jgi:hypothetical protein
MVAAGVETFSFDGLSRNDGQTIKDLRDFLRVDVDQWEGSWDVRSPLGNFVSKLLKEGKIYVADKTS